VDNVAAASVSVGHTRCTTSCSGHHHDIVIDTDYTDPGHQVKASCTLSDQVYNIVTVKSAIAHMSHGVMNFIVVQLHWVAVVIVAVSAVLLQQISHRDIFCVTAASLHTTSRNEQQSKPAAASHRMLKCDPHCCNRSALFASCHEQGDLANTTQGLTCSPAHTASIHSWWS
jgi:hypothetical protein